MNLPRVPALSKINEARPQTVGRASGPPLEFGGSYGGLDRIFWAF